MDTPVQSVFGRDMIFNLMSVVYWKVIIADEQKQVVIDNFQENSRRVMHDFAIGGGVYVEITGICRKLHYNK